MLLSTLSLSELKERLAKKEKDGLEEYVLGLHDYSPTKPIWWNTWAEKCTQSGPIRRRTDKCFKDMFGYLSSDIWLTNVCLWY